MQKQDSVDSTSLTSSMDEIIQRLDIQLQMTEDFDANQTKHAETTYSYIQSLKSDQAETRALVENLNSQLKEYKVLEAKTQALVNETLLHLESVEETTVESLQADGIKAICSELKKTKLQNNSLEELVRQLWFGLVNAHRIHSMKLEEVEHLESALEATELRYQKEQARSLMLIRKDCELAKQRKSEASQREAKLESELKKTKDHVDVLEAKLMVKETELQSLSEENKMLKSEVKNWEMESVEANDMKALEVNSMKREVERLRSALKATELRCQEEQTRSLILIRKAYELEKQRKFEASQRETKSESELKKAKYQLDVLEAKLMATDTTYAKGQVDESSHSAARATEQLEEAQASEEAVEVLPTGNNRKYIARSSSFDSNEHFATGKLYLSFLKDMDEDSSKKNNMLNKTGVLWKKMGNK